MTKFMDEANWQYSDWSQKIADLDLGIIENKVTINAANAADKAALDKAWDNLKANWVQLRSGHKEESESVRASWEAAAKEMRDAWQRFAPQQG